MAKRKQHSPQFKAKVALEVLKGLEITQQLAARFSIHPTQISHWKRHLLNGAPILFENGKAPLQGERDEAALYEQIGRLKMENEWLKKKWSGSAEMKRLLIEPDHPTLSIARPCELVGLAARPITTSLPRSPSKTSASCGSSTSSTSGPRSTAAAA